MEFGAIRSNQNQYDVTAQERLYKYYYATPTEPASDHYGLAGAFAYGLGDGYSDAATGLTSENRTSHLDALTDSLETPPSSDPLDCFFSGKRDFIARSVEDILGMIYERESLKYENIEKIDYDFCKVHSRLFPLEYWETGMHSEIDKTRTNIEKELVNLEREKRMEEVASWRDIARLRTDLREVMREFTQQKSREALLSGVKTPYTPGL